MPDPVVATPTAPAETQAAPKVDHLVEIEQLARSLSGVNPSGAETIGEKILEHVGALQDPKAYDAKMAAKKKADDEAEAARTKAREATRPKAKVA